jgi:hypothetical protein
MDPYLSAKPALHVHVYDNSVGGALVHEADLRFKGVGCNDSSISVDYFQYGYLFEGHWHEIRLPVEPDLYKVPKRVAHQLPAVAAARAAYTKNLKLSHLEATAGGWDKLDTEVQDHWIAIADAAVQAAKNAWKE